MDYSSDDLSRILFLESVNDILCIKGFRPVRCLDSVCKNTAGDLVVWVLL